VGASIGDQTHQVYLDVLRRRQLGATRVRVQGMSDVLAFAGVSVVRGANT
jgi:hypothetical protein